MVAEMICMNVYFDTLPDAKHPCGRFDPCPTSPGIRYLFLLPNFGFRLLTVLIVCLHQVLSHHGSVVTFYLMAFDEVHQHRP